MDGLDESLIQKFIQYDDLKRESIDFIKKIGYNKWNYLEESDPGITILENLLFAIVDLDYRIAFPIEDILASRNKNSNDIKCFYMPDEILNISPLSLKDYYKLFLDVDGVVNCRIIPITESNKLNGCYDIYLYIEPNTNENISNVTQKVLTRFYENRNLSEDINKIEVFDYVEVFIEAELEQNHAYIGEITSIEELISSIIVDIQVFFTRRIRFYKLSELLYEKGMSLDKIYDGPLLEHGFILDEELEKCRLPKSISVFEICEVILKNKHISSVLNFKLVNVKTGEVYSDFITFKKNQALRINFSKNKIKILLNNTEQKINNEKVTILSKRRYSYSLSNNVFNDEEMGIYTGNYRDLLDYLPLSNDFPLIYKLDDNNEDLLYNNEKDEQNHKLKCFILLFDQILSVYQVWLENIKLYFSLSNKSNYYVKNRLPVDIPNIETLLKLPSEYNILDKNINEEFCIQRKYIREFTFKNNSDKKSSCNKYIDWLYTDETNYLKNSLLDFQLDLFSNIISSTNSASLLSNANCKREYILHFNKIESERARGCVLFKNVQWEGGNISGLEKKFCIYWNIKNSNRRFLHKHIENSFTFWVNNDNINGRNLNKSLGNHCIYKSKYRNMLSLLLYYGDNRNNYQIEKKEVYKLKNNNEVADEVMLLKLNINNTENKFISIINDKDKYISQQIINDTIDSSIKNINRINIESEGLHVIENILLRPNIVEDNDLYFYNCRVTVIFPNWPKRFQNIKIREEIENWINNSIPIHLKADIIWINHIDMKKFEYKYYDWWIKKNNPEISREELDAINVEFTNIIKNLVLKYNSTSVNIVNEKHSRDKFSNPITDILDEYTSTYNVFDDPIR